jgi:hypothetical protein
LLLRLVLIFLICYVVLSAAKILARRGKTKSAKFSDAGEEMVLDPQCQTYVPKSDAVLVSGKHFCSQECARLYLSR